MQTCNSVDQEVALGLRTGVLFRSTCCQSRRSGPRRLSIHRRIAAQTRLPRSECATRRRAASRGALVGPSRIRRRHRQTVRGGVSECVGIMKDQASRPTDLVNAGSEHVHGMRNAVVNAVGGAQYRRGAQTFVFLQGVKALCSSQRILRSTTHSDAQPRSESGGVSAPVANSVNADIMGTAN